MSTLLESLLTEEQRAECERHDAEQRELVRVVRGEPYTWPMVPWRNQEAPHRRRSEPRASRFSDLLETT